MKIGLKDLKEYIARGLLNLANLDRTSRGNAKVNERLQEPESGPKSSVPWALCGIQMRC